MLKKLFGRKDNDKESHKDSEYKFVTKEPTTNTCPYCDVKFEKIPTRKKKCPECGEYIFVRWGKLYTEEGKNIKDWLDNYNMQELGVTREMFNKTRKELSQEFGFVASVNDTLWRLLNRVVANENSYRHKRMAYQAMESVLKSEGKNTDDIVAQAREMEFMEGKIANEESAKAFRKELLQVKENNNITGNQSVVRILTCNDEHVCDECKRLSKTTFTVDEALHTMPIPNKCTNNECRCLYGFFTS